MTDFTKFSDEVHDTYKTMQEHELYFVDIDRDELWAHYLDSFPAGTNEIHKTRREYDCSCCRHFIKNIGGVVAYINGAMVSVWDCAPVYPYNVVADAMSEYVKSRPIKRIFRSSEDKYGAEVTPQLGEDGKTIRWRHFMGKVNPNHRTDRVGEFNSKIESSYQVFRRGLEEITDEALTTVKELIESDSLYRGAEFKKVVGHFQDVKKIYDIRDDEGKEAFIWQHIMLPCARFRNTVIGTLCVDLSEGVELEKAVASFESKVAPTNYKRSKALVTPQMVAKAVEKLDELGLRSATERRHATARDVSVQDVIYVNQSRVQLKDTLLDTLLSSAKPGTVPDNPTEIGIVNFLTKIKQVKELHMVLEPRHTSNFMSVTAPVTASEATLFPWGNNFSWSYDGDVTDSVKERVKRAGGNVKADLRVSLSWFNTDDLDLHCTTPTEEHIFYGNKARILDVDMNVRGESREPVENMAFMAPATGTYNFRVHNYTKREDGDTGFELEVEYKGRVYNYRGPSPRDSGYSDTLEINVQPGGISIHHGKSLTPGRNNTEKWGIKTGDKVPVNMLIKSPNHWGDYDKGNMHWMFMLEGCLNPEPVRSIYNEFLKPELHEHRKVFEVLGDKTKALYADDQLSGVGFSSTKRESVIMLADGRPYKVNF